MANEKLNLINPVNKTEQRKEIAAELKNATQKLQEARQMGDTAKIAKLEEIVENLTGTLSRI